MAGTPLAVDAAMSVRDAFLAQSARNAPLRATREDVSLTRMPTALITGASRGIGRATALHLAAAGWDVVAGARVPADLDALVAAAPAGRITAVPLDVTDADHVAALDAALPARVDALVNNAGIAVGGPIEGLALDELRRQLEVNVVGQVAVTQALLPRLRASRGRIVFVSSISGRVSVPMTGAYNASKYALEAIADALRLELRTWGIKVSLVEPGAIDTDIWRNVDETVEATLAALTPEHRALYAPHADGMRRTTKRVQGQTSPVAKVATTIEKALTAPRPRARYLVGVDAKVQAAIGALPTPVADVAFGKATGTP